MQQINQIPKQFLDRLANLIPPGNYQDVINAITGMRLTTLRVNHLKYDTKSLKKLFRQNQINFEISDWYNEAFIIKNKNARELSELEEYKKGYFYIQNLSSMIPALVLDPQPDNKILDICAAPGSKTTQMATYMNNQGQITAVDSSPIRILKLKSNLATQGIINTKTFLMHAESIWQKFPEYFDKTLVDVPCSMEGKIQSMFPKSYKDWSVKRIRILTEKQKWILRSAISATKPGGIIVYSTCTIASEENEGVIDWILRKEKGNINLLEIKIDNLDFFPGLTQWDNRKYDKSLVKSVRIYPSNIYEGFFVAKIQKNISNIPKSLIN